jgi:hypothetical protein
MQAKIIGPKLLIPSLSNRNKTTQKAKNALQNPLLQKL